MKSGNRLKLQLWFADFLTPSRLADFFHEYTEIPYLLIPAFCPGNVLSFRSYILQMRNNLQKIMKWREIDDGMEFVNDTKVMDDTIW